jgi:7,8-dihydropterin-6-yl-methyl-4-(beta-D-ribofuranosyl)aminobenzene 5'-phosphate synthase
MKKGITILLTVSIFLFAACTQPEPTPGSPSVIPLNDTSSPEHAPEAEELFSGVYTTGELGNGIKEQSLIITTSQGLVIITGCAHPGVVNIVRKAKEMLVEKPVYLVMGGFHMTGAATSQIESVIEGFRELGVKKIAPCHCSGDETRKLFREDYGEDYINSGAGKIITLP